MSGTGKVIVSYATAGSNKDYWTRSLYRFARYDARERNVLLDDVVSGIGAYIDKNRNDAIRQALGTEAEWIFSVDNDVGFHWKLPYRLLDLAHPVDRPIMSAMIIGCQGPGGILAPMFYRRSKKEGEEGMYETLGELDDRAPLLIDSCGMGCVMIHRSVFEKCPEPWYLSSYPDGGVSYQGEDFYFCAKAQEHGFTLWGDCGSQTVHEKTTMLDAYSLLEENALNKLKASMRPSNG